MTETTTDKTGADVTIGLDLSGPIPSFTVAVDGGEPIGRPTDKDIALIIRLRA